MTTPLATTISPTPALVLPAAVPAPTTTAPAPAASAPAFTPAPVSAGSVFGDLTAPASQADDETLQYALSLGLGADLGIPESGNPKPESAPAAAAAVTAPAAVPETAEQKIARLEAENAQLKSGKPLAPEETPAAAGAAQPPVPALPAAPAVTPTPDAPLVNLRTAEQLSLTEKAAKQLREWAIQHRADGGQMPLELAQLVENAEAARLGREPVKVTTAPTIDAETVPQIELATERMLATNLPQHRAVLAGHQESLAVLQKDFAAYLNPQTEEGKVFAAVTQQYPQLLARPEGLLLARDLTTGFLANRPKAPESGVRSPESVQPPAPAAAPALTVLPAPTVTTTTGQAVPLAPAAPTGGIAVGGVPITQRRIDDAMARLEAGNHSEEDLITLSAAAV